MKSSGATYNPGIWPVCLQPVKLIGQYRAIYAKMLNTRKPPPLSDGWYSPTQAKRVSTAIWADFDGNSFEVSSVTRRINGEVVRPYGFTDYLYIGPVYKWVAGGMIARKLNFA
jgi:hypothetical protein